MNYAQIIALFFFMMWGIELFLLCNRIKTSNKEREIRHNLIIRQSQMIDRLRNIINNQNEN